MRHGRPLTVALIDIDHFKRVNDRYSHAVGDVALKELARLFASAIRHTDLVARLGGEEFVMVLVETDAAAARQACEKLRLAVATHDWKRVHSGLALTVSIGYCADTTVAGAARMLAVADRNLYVAQGEGTNCVVGDRGRVKATRRGSRRPVPYAPDASPCASQLAHQPDHHAEDLERALGADHGIGLVLGLAARSGRGRARGASA